MKDLTMVKNNVTETDKVKTTVTVEDLKRYAFHTSPPLVYSLVAELSCPDGSGSGSGVSSTTGADPMESEMENKNLVGYALYFKTYSTWKGQAVHLEDLCIRPEYKSRELGKMFLKYLGEMALRENYARISLERVCLDWNKEEIEFYKKHGAEDVTVKEHWESYRFDKEALQKLAS